MQRPDPDPAAPSLKELEELKSNSEALKARIEALKRSQNMPLDANLGDPQFEERAKDGHLDLPPEDDE